MIFQEKKIILSNNKNCLFRSPLPQDAAVVLDFLRNTAAETDFLIRYPEEITITIEEESEKLSSMSSSPRAVMIAVFCDDCLVGLAGLSPVAERSKLIHRSSIGLAIISGYWGMGIGSLLINELSFLASKIGYEQIELGVHRNNSRAIHLYQRHNFEVYGRLKNAFKLKDGTYSDEYLMVKRLNITFD